MAATWLVISRFAEEPFKTERTVQMQTLSLALPSPPPLCLLLVCWYVCVGLCDLCENV